MAGKRPTAPMTIDAAAEFVQRARDPTESRLSELLFGSATVSLLGSGGETAAAAHVPEKRRRKPAGKRNKSRARIGGPDSDEDSDDHDDCDNERDDDGESEASAALRPAWVDSDDEREQVDLTRINKLKKLRKTEGEVKVSGTEYQQRLQNQHAKSFGQPSWVEQSLAKLSGTEKRKSGAGDADSSDDDDDDDPMLRETVEYRPKSTVLDPNLLNIRRMKNVNQEEPCSAVVQSIQFHHSIPLMLVSSLEKKVRIFQVDGLRNNKVQSIYFPNLPVHKAVFTPDGTKVIACGRRKYFYMYDMHSGRVDEISNIMGCDEKSLERFELSPDGKYMLILGSNGVIRVIAAHSRQWICDLKMNGNASCATFSPDSRFVYTSGDVGDILCWDLRTRRCVHRWADVGSMNTQSLTVSPCGSMLASGSYSGVVNLFALQNGIPLTTSGGGGGGGDTESLFSTSSTGDAKRGLRKAFMNLTTSVRSLKFSSDSQILAFASRVQKDAVKMAHVPSLGVYSNWPTLKTNMNYVNCVDISPNSGYFACGNDKGHVLLFQLKHYSQY